MSTGLRLGAPGIYRVAPDRTDTALRPVALDVAGFVGVAARGPIDEPVAVQSVAQYRARFGTGPGLLPLAVEAFFGQGGSKAWVVRAAPPFRDEARALVEQGTDRGGWTPLVTTGGHHVRWVARDEGTWADQLTVTLTATVTQRFRAIPTPSARSLGTSGPPGFAPAAVTHVPALTDRLVVPPLGVRAPAGSLLHLRGRELALVDRIRWIEESAPREIASGVSAFTWVLDQPLPAGTESIGLVTACVTVEDHVRDGAVIERFDVGLSPRHPLWLASALDAGSLLIAADPSWALPAVAGDERIVLSDPLLPPVGSMLVRPGEDRYAQIMAADLLGRPPDEPPDADPAGNQPHRGAEQLARVEELGLFAVPDLTWNGVIPEAIEVEPQDPPPDEFTRCTDPQPPARLRIPGAEAVYLDGRLPDELTQTRLRQQWLVQLAGAFERFVVLLDVPLGLSGSAVADWRAGFDNSYAAAYHPWAGVIPGQTLGQLTAPMPGGPAALRSRTLPAASVSRLVPPSSFAAGIIAAQELQVGLATGPANQLAAGVVTISEHVTSVEHDTLHRLDINVFRAERDGFRLTAARTLSSNRDYRQLTVRRLLTMLRLTLDRESRWVVFEPHTAALRAVLVLHIDDLLRGQFLAGAFAGATEAESYFVRAGDALNPPESIALGRIVLEVGVAPSEPLEFIVLRITQDGDVLAVEEVARGNP